MRKSAKMLAEMLGIKAEEVNPKLEKIGYLEKKAGTWSLTEEGKKHGELHFFDNGYGGRGAIGGSYAIWDDDVANRIGDPKAHLKEVNNNRKKAGMSAIKSWDEYFKR